MTDIRTKILLTAFAVFLLQNPAQAQGDMFPVDEFYGGGIGYSAMFMTLDSIPGSNQLKTLGSNPDEFKTPFVIHGGEGFTHIAGRWRLGGYAGMGSAEISDIFQVYLYVNRDTVSGYQAPTPGSTGDYAVAYESEFPKPSIRARFSFLLGAVTMEYVVPIYRDLEVTAGALMGIGRVNLSFDQFAGNPEWGNLFSNNMYGEVTNGIIYYPVDTTGSNIQTAIDTLQGQYLIPINVTHNMTNLTGTFFNFQPYVAIKWQFLDRMGLRISAGFNKGTIAKSGWVLNDHYPIDDSPKSAIQGMTIRAMVYFGL